MGHVTTYRIEHRSTHRGRVESGTTYLRTLLTPRDGGGQRLHGSELHVTPEPSETSEYRDFDGNRIIHVDVPAPYEELELLARSTVTVTRRPADPAHLPALSWEQVVAAVRQIRATGRGEHGEGMAAVIAIVEGAQPSTLAPAPSDDALRLIPPGTPLVALLAGLAEQMSTAISRSSTSVGTDKALRDGVGSIQDLAHVMCSLARGVGLSARYVAGYRHEPGVDGAHAWVAVWLPGGGWLHVDPASGGFIDGRYVVLGWGRDALDVSPVRGVRLGPGGPVTRTDQVTLTPVDAPAGSTG